MPIQLSLYGSASKQKSTLSYLKSLRVYYFPLLFFILLKNALPIIWWLYGITFLKDLLLYTE